MDEVIEKARGKSAWKAFAVQLENTISALAKIPIYLAERATKGDTSYAYLKATPFLEAAGDVVVSWLLLWGALIAQEKLEALYRQKDANDPRAQEAVIEESSEAAFLAGKVQSARFFIGNILPVTAGKFEAIMWGDVSAWEIKETSFGA